MALLDIVNQGVLAIGIPSVVGGIVYVANKLVHIGKRLQSVDEIRKSLEYDIKPDIKQMESNMKGIEEKVGDIRERLVIVEDHVETLWKNKLAPTHSPRQLNEAGSRILEESGIQQLIEEKKRVLLEKIREKQPTNPYDAERSIEEVTLLIPKLFPETIDTLKNGAFKTGSDIDAILFVGSIYLRNKIFKDLGFDIDDLDKETSRKNKK